MCNEKGGGGFSQRDGEWKRTRPLILPGEGRKEGQKQEVEETKVPTVVSRLERRDGKGTCDGGVRPDDRPRRVNGCRTVGYVDGHLR